jgi:hypothetical protein
LGECVQALLLTLRSKLGADGERYVYLDGEGDQGMGAYSTFEKNSAITADFSVIDPYRMMRTDGSAEKSNRPIVHAWCVRVNINATRCKHFGE